MPADTSYLQIERASFEPNGRPVFLQRQTASDAADSRVDRGTALPGRAVATAIPHAPNALSRWIRLLCERQMNLAE